MTLASPFNISVGVVANPEIAEGPAFGRSPTAGLAAPFAAGTTAAGTTAAGTTAAGITAARTTAAGGHPLSGRGDASEALPAANANGKPGSTIPESIGLIRGSRR